MRRAKTKFRPSSGPVSRVPLRTTPSSPQNVRKDMAPIISTQDGQAKSPMSPIKLVIQNDQNKCILSPINQSPSTIETSNTGDLSDALVVLEEVTEGITGDVMLVPDNDLADQNIEDQLFRFKKKNTELTLCKQNSISAKSSRAIAIARRKQAEKNVEKNTADGGQLDRTEVSMSDLIFVGSSCGFHEMDFSKRLRERREAKERATTSSQLSEEPPKIPTPVPEKEKPIKIPTIVKPKVRLDENGKIVVDRCSLYQSISNESPTLISDEIIEDFEENFQSINSLSFRKRKCGRRSKNWSEEESDRFYEALTIVGNDFQAISAAFSQRGMAEIKRKFWRENKQNPVRIDQLLRVHESGESTWDLSHLIEKDIKYYANIDEIEAEKKKKREIRKQKRNERQINNNEPCKQLLYTKTSEADLDDLIPEQSKPNS